jgi:hypothetical protein
MVPIGGTLRLWMQIYNVYRMTYRILYAIRLFCYFIAFGSENYEIFADDNGSITKYITNYNSSSEKTLITLITLTQGVIIYLSEKFT